MSKNNKILEDVSKLASSALATAVNVKNDLSHYIKNQVEVLVKKMNFVTRKEFNTIKKVVIQNQLDIEKLIGKKKNSKESKRTSGTSTSSAKTSSTGTKSSKNNTRKKSPSTKNKK